MKRLFCIFSIAVLLLVFKNANSQNLFWAKRLGGAGEDHGYSIAIDASKNVYVTGWFGPSADFDPGPGTFGLTSAGSADVFITKLNASGNLVWAKHMGGLSSDNSYAIAVDTAENVYIAGSFRGIADFDPGPGTFNLTSTGGVDVFIAKLDAFGNLVWAKNIGGIATDQGHSMTIDIYGNVYATGFFEGTVDFNPGAGTFNLTAGGAECFIIKLDASGNFTWAKKMGGQGYSIKVDRHEYIYVTGWFEGAEDFDPGAGVFSLSSAGEADIFIVKLNASGNLIWAKNFGGSGTDFGYSTAIDILGNVYGSGWFENSADFDPGSGTYTLTSAGSKDAYIIKLDTVGNLVWAKQLGGPLDEFCFSVAVDDSGNVYTTGYFNNSSDFNPGVGIFNLSSAGGTDAFITKLDVLGNLVWAKQLGGTLDDLGQSLTVDASGSVYVTGYFRATTDFNPGPGVFNLTSVSDNDAFVLKLSQSTPYMVQGKVIGDLNANCSDDTSDIVFPSILIKAEPSYYYGMSDTSGNYTIYLPDTGSYAVSVLLQDTIWQPHCSTSYNVRLTTTPDTANGVDFDLRAAFYCTKLAVEIGTPRLRRCFDNTHAFTYRNTGTLPATNAYIEVDFGDYLHPQTSTLPWSTVSGSVYTFPIGNLNIYQQGSFNVTALLDCAASLGSTQCVTAHIYPDSSCVPPPNGWDKSETKVTGACINDSLVCFTIKNRSSPPSGNMHGPAPCRLYVNDTLITQGTYQLAGRDSMIKCYPANGKTYRLEADQRLGHPGNSNPKAIVEACGSPANFGFVNTVAQDDADLFVETFCMTVIGSYDPNDKQVSPIGITSNQYITADDELEYLIRFQNTGTDTAFKVVIRDTITTDVLDIATLTSGASSHDYTFNIYGQGIAEWTFDNILLPDSNVNESESHGFVKFKIQQQSGNPDGTRIENRAAIYFDFNAPVITNTAWNVVNEADMPVSLFSVNTNAICSTPDSGGIVNVSAAGGLGPYTYEWSNGEAGSTVSNLSQGVYSVTVTDEAESVFIDSFNIAAPINASISTQSAVTCFGGNDAAAKVITSGGVQPYIYNWSNGQTTSTANDLSAGNHMVTIMDANGCDLITSVTIQDGYQINIGSITGTDSAYINQSATYSVNAGFSYTWNVTNGSILSGQNTNSVEVDWSATGEGTLEVVATDQVCSETIFKTITLVDPTGIRNDLLNSIEAYPNPTNGTITLKASNIKTVASLKLYDSIGKQILQQNVKPDELQQGIILVLNDKNAGIFFLSIKTESGTRVMKLVKY